MHFSENPNFSGVIFFPTLSNSETEYNIKLFPLASEVISEENMNWTIIKESYRSILQSVPVILAHTSEIT